MLIVFNGHAAVIACFSRIPAVVSRALDNIGRVYARIGQFQKAISM